MLRTPRRDLRSAHPFGVLPVSDDAPLDVQDSDRLLDFVVRDPEFRDEILAHFNEPMLHGLEVVRCVGYGEDESDCYIIGRRGSPKNDLIWMTAVGGYTFLDRIKGQNASTSEEQGDWDDLRRLDDWLTRSGCPREDAPLIMNWENEPRTASRRWPHLDALMNAFLTRDPSRPAVSDRAFLVEYTEQSDIQAVLDLYKDIEEFRSVHEGNLSDAFRRAYPNGLQFAERSHPPETASGIWSNGAEFSVNQWLAKISQMVRSHLSEERNPRSVTLHRQMAIAEQVLVEEAEVLRLLAPNDGGHANAPIDCGCHRCDQKKREAGLLWDGHIRYACEICGCKRCPHHTDHRNKCTGSNEPGQPGSDY